VTFPAAREEGAHQLVNVSDTTFRYLCFSTMVEPDVMIYPGSEKIGAFVGAALGAPKEKKRTLSKFLKEDAEVGYFEDEE
jgi:uncharacterized cupin superfamily protein